MAKQYPAGTASSPSAQQAVEFSAAGRRLIPNTRGDPRSRRWAHAEFRGKANHIRRRIVRDPHERVLPGVSVLPLDEQSVRDRILLGHLRECLLGLAPARIGVAVGGQRHHVERRQQPKGMQLTGDAPPFVGGVTDEEGRRLGDAFGDLRLGLASDPSLARIAAQQLDAIRLRRWMGQKGPLLTFGRLGFDAGFLPPSNRPGKAP